MRLCFLTHHKCASSALYDYVVDLARLNGMTLFGSHIGATSLRADYDICFLANAEYHHVRGKVGGACLHLVRNPLNIVQSAYYSHKITHPLDGWPELASQRARLLSMSVEEGMLSTARFCNQAEVLTATAGPLYALNHWNFDDPAIATVRVEDYFDRFTDALRAQFPALAPDLAWPDQAAFAFTEYSAGRAPGTVDDHSHYRSGRRDAWKDELPPAVIDYVRSECGELLERYYPECL